MGQKSIPQSLRLNFLKNWQSDWVSHKKEYSNILNIDYNLRQYFKIICNQKQINLINIKIKRINNFFLIYVSIHNPFKGKSLKLNKNKLENNLGVFLNSFKDFKNYKIKIFIIKTTLKSLKKGFKYYKITKNLKNNKLPNNLRKFVGILATVIFTQKAELLNFLLLKNLKRTPRHRQFLRNFDRILKKIFNICNDFMGYKIQFKGRVNGIERSRKIVLNSGKIPLSTLKYDIKYDLKEVLTPYGICSIKTWLFFKKSKSKFIISKKKCYFQKKKNLKNNLKV